MKFYLIVFAAILVLFFFSIDASRAATAVTVQPIGDADLDALIDQKDNRLIISFMAAWCGPCIDELPALNKLYRKYKDQGLNVIGISIDIEGAAAMQPVINKLKIEFPVYWLGETAVTRFKLNAIPMLLIVKQGKIVERIPGRRPDIFLENKVKDLIGHKTLN